MADQLPLGDLVEPKETPKSLQSNILTGRAVTLRAPVPDDARNLYTSTHGDPIREAVWTYMGYGPWPDEAGFRRWVSDRTSSVDPLWFTVVSNRSGESIGMTTMLNYDAHHRRVELGHIWYIPEAQRTDANTEAMCLMLIEAFEYYRCRRVEWKCDSLNARSRRAALRLGFQFEGIFSSHMIVKGRNRDTAWFAMTDRDWPDAKKRLDELRS